ncbi:MAG: hypothetical protein CMO98_14020, partial [Woeseia sp.]|nr:hypothetical protein [Woeseia sp.]
MNLLGLHTFITLSVLFIGCSKHDEITAAINPKGKKSSNSSRKLALPQAGRLAFHSYTAYDLDDFGKRWLDGQIHVCDF